MSMIAITASFRRDIHTCKYLLAVTALSFPFFFLEGTFDLDRPLFRNNNHMFRFVSKLHITRVPDPSVAYSHLHSPPPQPATGASSQNQNSIPHRDNCFENFPCVLMHMFSMGPIVCETTLFHPPSSVSGGEAAMQCEFLDGFCFFLSSITRDLPEAAAGAPLQSLPCFVYAILKLPMHSSCFGYCGAIRFVE